MPICWAKIYLAYTVYQMFQSKLNPVLFKLSDANDRQYFCLNAHYAPGSVGISSGPKRPRSVKLG